MAKKNEKVTLTPFPTGAIGPFYEYKMPKSMAYAITHDTNGKLLKVAKGRTDKYLIDYMNDQSGMRGTCVRVIVS